MKLNDIPKHNIHQVPDGYFDRLPSRIMEQTAAKGASAAPSAFFSIWRTARIALVPFVLLLVFVSVFVYQYRQPQPAKPAYASLASLPKAEIVAYLDSYASLEASHFEELALSDKELTADFLNISSDAAEAELEYYRLNQLVY